MKALTLTLLAPIVVLAGCTSYRVAYVDPAYSARPVAVVPPPAVIAATPLADIDGDGVPDVSDRMPYDARYR